MKNRKDVLKLLFEREWFAMKLYYTTKARKNKKFIMQAKQFEGLCD